MWVHFQRHIDSIIIYYRYYHITGNIIYFSCVESRLIYIPQRGIITFALADHLHCCVADSWLLNVTSLLWDLRSYALTRFPARLWMRDRRWNDHARCAVRQTNSERKGRLNVVGMWQTVEEGTLTPSHIRLAGSRCLTLLHHSHADVKPPWRKPEWFR